MRRPRLFGSGPKASEGSSPSRTILFHGNEVNPLADLSKRPRHLSADDLLWVDIQR